MSVPIPVHQGWFELAEFHPEYAQENWATVDHSCDGADQPQVVALWWLPGRIPWPGWLRGVWFSGRPWDMVRPSRLSGETNLALCWFHYPRVDVYKKLMGKSTHCWMGTSTISMAIFNSYVSHYHEFLLDGFSQGDGSRVWIIPAVFEGYLSRPLNERSLALGESLSCLSCVGRWNLRDNSAFFWIYKVFSETVVKPIEFPFNKAIQQIPIGSMYGIFTNIYPINDPNVGKYTIHGSYGIVLFQFAPAPIGSHSEPSGTTCCCFRGAQNLPISQRVMAVWQQGNWVLTKWRDPADTLGSQTWRWENLWNGL